MHSSSTMLPTRRILPYSTISITMQIRNIFSVSHSANLGKYIAQQKAQNALRLGRQFSIGLPNFCTYDISRISISEEPTDVILF